MKPPPFEYLVADSVAAAVAALAQGDAKIIAGGQSLVPMLNFRLLRPSVLVDINREICPDNLCRAVIGNALVYRDKSHLTATFARTLAPALERGLKRAGLS